jgi:hypothetical protein
MTTTRQIVVPLDPYPPNCDFRIVDFRYVDHLQLVRYNARPKNSDPSSDWQLAEDYAVEIDIDYRDASSQHKQECWTVVAPRGLYTDLSSVPAFGRWIVSKVGVHLEASIIHDYLYIKWTDDRLNDHRFCDWVFADECLRAGMKNLSEFSWFQRFVVNFAVGTAGLLFFWRKKNRLADLLAKWMPHLDYRPHVPVPPGDQAPPKGISIWTQSYLALTVLVFAAIAIMGVDVLLGTIGVGHWRPDIAWLVRGAKSFLLGTIGIVGVMVIFGLVFYIFMRWFIRIRNRLA